MPLSLFELKDRAIRFAQEWQGATDGRQGFIDLLWKAPLLPPPAKACKSAKT